MLRIVRFVLALRHWALVVAILCMIALSVSLAHARAPRLLKLTAPKAFGMTALTERIVVDPEMPPAKRALLPAALTEAGARLEPAWGRLLATPTIVACSSQPCFESFGGTGRGMHFGPAILLGPRGLNATIIAHELTHAEVTERVGYFNEIPTWFNEGLAVVLCRDERYSEQEYQARYASRAPSTPARSMESLSDFFAAEDPYLVAAHEVRAWLSAAGPLGLQRLFGELQRGSEFDVALNTAREGR